MNIMGYERIKDSVVFGFEEYIDEEGLNVAQTSAKILEEEWTRVNDSLFTKTSYFVSIAIESLKYKEISDFIYDKLDIDLENTKFEEHVDNYDVDQLLQDIQICRKLINDKSEYKIRETSDSTKSRVEYILELKAD
ncbi:hypothetical protein [Paenibacillus sp. NPDC058071]|uniref:hypothetical protein n=1 Tax=Paenibacillus sp. NPDC058071 TaxID=3346326 RepID=UPI0036DA4C12